MNDVAYRINNTGVVTKFGTVAVNNGSRQNMGETASGSVYYRDQRVTVPNETVCTGLVDRFDDTTYYTA